MSLNKHLITPFPWRSIRAMTAMLTFVLVLVACKDEKHPGYEFMPDMAHQKSYQPYAESGVFPDSMSARRPVPGTVPRGYEPYPYPDTKEGYEQAGEALTNPVPLTDSVMAEGKRLYSIHCQVCHGEQGDGDGSITLTAGGAFPPPPAYSSHEVRDLPEGKMFHSTTYGKGTMGSYASQLTKKERWMIIHYIKTLQQTDEEDADEATAEAEEASETTADTSS